MGIGILSHNKQGSDWGNGNPRGERVYRPLSEQSRIKALVNKRKVLLISHKPEFQGQSIPMWADGRGDAKMDDFLKVMKTLIPADYPTWYLCLFHEPEDDVMAGRYTPDQFKKAFQRFVTRVVRKMPNARSTLCMMRSIYATDPYGNPEPRTKDFNLDPGENYVDLYAGDPYNPCHLQPGYEYRSLEWLAAPMAGYAEARGRPAAVWETGTQPDDRNPQWILDAGTFAREAKLLHLSFFHGTGDRGSWNIEQTPENVESLRKLAGRKYFNPSA